MTGPNTGLVIKLNESDSEHNLFNRDSIEMKPEHNVEKTINSTYLTGNALDFGKYMVFINTNNLSEGYYELVGVRPMYDQTGVVKGFYLLNNS